MDEKWLGARHASPLAMKLQHSMSWGKQSKYNPQKHNRQSNRLRGYDYTQSGAYFVTMVTYQRACLFGEIVEGEMRLNELGQIADDCWRAIPDHFDRVELGAYVVMPNHVHGIILINETNADVGATHESPQPDPPQRPRGPIPGSLGAIIGSYKSAVSRRIGQEYDIAGIWQRNYHDRIIRNRRELDAIWRYIEANPANWDADNENPRPR